MVALFFCVSFTGCGQEINNQTSDNYENNETKIKKDMKNEKYKNLQNGDTIYFGEYPQSLVDDDIIISELDKLIKQDKWSNMNHYSVRCDNEGNFTYGKSDNWLYQDLEYDNCRYRALAMKNGYAFGTESRNSFSDTTKYLEEPYYFKYEPISWKILDKEKGVVLCNQIIDSHEYYSDVELQYHTSPYGYFEQNGFFCKDSTLTAYTGEYASSDLREWLNGSFYDTAFSSNERKAIVETTLTYKQIEKNEFQSKETVDKVYILSDEDLRNNEQYGFNPSERSDTKDYNRVFNATDYSAKVSGRNYTNETPYWTRTADIRQTMVINNVGCLCNGTCSYMLEGVLPALTLDLKKAIK